MKKIISVLILISILIVPNGVLAADALYRLMHNDQDALVIAEVLDVNDESIKFKVIKQIISPEDLNVNDKKEQIKIDEFSLPKEETDRLYYNTVNKEVSYKIGEGYLISLDKIDNSYKVAWGIYKLSSTDYKTLDVVYENMSEKSFDMDAIALKEFINSDGVKNEFTFYEDKIVYNDEEIFKENKDNVVEKNEKKDLSNEIKSENKISNQVIEEDFSYFGVGIERKFLYIGMGVVVIALVFRFRKKR